ncbi:MAG: 6-bladed beta-propeller [Candidatus Binatus sp.]|uniref:6-bladed beta-propeller n=1 Tax=Candidatus Binatus sp. TaxID=2811406 RepID=UPI003CBD25EF
MNSLRAMFKPIIAAVALATALGCQPTGSLNGLAGGNASSSVSEDIVWPLPPNPARIRYVRSISVPGDVGIKRGFFGTILDAVTRRPQERFIRPTGVAESDGAIYVADPGAPALWIFDPQNQASVAVRELGGEALLSPVAVTPERDGRAFVADSLINKVFLVDRSGKMVSTIADSGLKRPVALAWDNAGGRLYVADAVGQQVVVYGSAGQRLLSWGSRGSGDGEFNFPAYIALSRSGEVLVTDALNYRVQAFDQNGKFLWKMGRQGDGSGDFAAPKGVATDSEGHLYVVDALFDGVQIFDREGTLLLGFGSNGRLAGEFSLPTGAFIDARDRIYVADSYNQRVQVFEFVGHSGDSQPAETAKR